MTCPPPLATKATTDRGRYRVDGLPAGEYLLSFRGAGFEPLWYPQALVPDNAEPVALEASHRMTGVDVALGGTPATVSGVVEGEDISDAVVALRTPAATTVTTVGGATPTAPEDGATLQTMPVAADGSFSFGNVPSPSVYEVVVTKEGYTTATQRVDVGGRRGARRHRDQPGPWQRHHHRRGQLRRRTSRRRHDHGHGRGVVGDDDVGQRGRQLHPAQAAPRPRRTRSSPARRAWRPRRSASPSPTARS
ncbi:carboxypeptidase-like regulatory domain-containing protein [Nocardioides sp. TF02-7]|uniref:carboxypeptidase-like regulatory domain-containing protein n=1 Tax=Nocardioides sp. TF02-7 TaxID=2917724 RepID=UPI001F054605|nr:carboxypeptidase-like regulatory domain-containing protein [Nocardioides sp. TF02-7]UMG91033.1 carboxypeptidase-like regulatory domain-containing protein [Nocardioides sp. TF02-7]